MVRLFRLAAEQGAMEAQRVLSQSYEFGQGVPLTVEKRLDGIGKLLLRELLTQR